MEACTQIENKEDLTREIKALALKLGFHGVGVTSADPASEAGRRLMFWLSDGYAAGMTYLQKNPEIRFDPRRRFPEAQSIISLVLNYYQPQPLTPEKEPDQKSEDVSGKIARYAWGEDYHAIIEKKLAVLIQEITERGGRCWKGYVDHGPLLEKAFAERAGVGFIGKNTTLITSAYGSWVFLAEVVTDLNLIADEPATTQCGSCRRCIEACPTDALREPYRLDARRCISYLTIENKNSIPERFIPKMDGWLFGCDICQEVCPFNGNPVPSDEPAFSPAFGAGPFLTSKEIETIPDKTAFKQCFGRTALLRAKHAGLTRNAKALRQAKEAKSEPL